MPTMPSTKSQIFIAVATLAVLAGSIFGSVSAAPIAGDQQLFDPRSVANITDPFGGTHPLGGPHELDHHDHIAAEVDRLYAAHQAHHAAAHAHDKAASTHGSGRQHDSHAQRAAHHRNMANNHHTAAQAHHHGRRQLAARSGLFDGLETLD